MRAFAPPSFGLDRPEFHATVIEQRLAHSGEYVRHIPADGIPQWVVMNYQFIPIDNNLAIDYSLSGTNPKLWGYVEHFADKPSQYKDGDSVRPARGSQFEVRGFLYNVKRVAINHVGYVHIDMVLDDKCKTVRPEFFDEQSALVCSSKPECP